MFFFFQQKTAYEMRISDWSSDVCSSDLHLIPFSTIDKLTNHTRDYGYHYGEYNVAHRENVDEAIAQLELAFKDLMEDPELAREVLEEISIPGVRSEEHTSELQSLMRISYAVFCLKKKNTTIQNYRLNSIVQLR